MLLATTALHRMAPHCAAWQGTILPCMSCALHDALYFGEKPESLPGASHLHREPDYSQIDLSTPSSCKRQASECSHVATWTFPTRLVALWFSDHVGSYKISLSDNIFKCCLGHQSRCRRPKPSTGGAGPTRRHKGVQQFSEQFFPFLFLHSPVQTLKDERKVDSPSGFFARGLRVVPSNYRVLCRGPAHKQARCN